MSVPMKYREIGDFHEYYSGKRIAPYLTIFVGGNHEAGNYLFELYYGGWVAPNIYYLGAANVLRFGPLRIAGLSGIWKGYDYNKPHFERLPYNSDEVKSIYHVRELDVRKLMQIRTQVDIGLSHDWPKGAELYGDYEHLFRVKRGFREDSDAGKLGSTAAKHVLDRLRPPFWFSAHLHVRYAALITHGEYVHPKKSYADRQILRFSQGLDGPSDLTHSTSEKPNTNFVPQEKPFEDNLMAWNNFSQVAAKQDAEDNEKFLQEQSQPGENHSLDVDSISCTWRQIQADDPNRKVIAVQKSNAVKNEDEIDLDLDSDNEETGVQMDVDDNVKADTSNPVQSSEPTEPMIPSSSKDTEPVSEDLREQLPEAFKRQLPEPAVYGPLPGAIANTQTNFLALGKCQEHRDCSDYLELMEIFPTPEEGGIQRPCELQYDKEWLAISRALEHNLVVGDPSSQVPSDLGDGNYKVNIEASEAWVQEHIVDKGKITIPQNFEITAPEYDPEVPMNTTDMPPEYNNPQTAAFCELLGIPNKFYLSPVEREQRMIAGPRPSNNVRTQHGGQGWWPRQGRNFSSGRGGRGRGGRGRGGFRHGQPF
jgi:lariat debranching enzyme